MKFMNCDIMQGIRARMLDGDSQRMCENCKYQDSVGKVSGRQRQLLKSAINANVFDRTFCSSPHWSHFEYSYNNHGLTTNYPVDLQIDLGNTCNSSCIMCSPVYSSRLANDYVKLSKIEPGLFTEIATQKNWADDPVLVDKFVNELTNIPNIKYIHFLGGETLYLESFYTICERLIDAGLAKNISIGTTTNCTMYNPKLERIIRNFKHVHLGVSVEAFHPINDYIRWPSKISEVNDIINQFLELRQQTNLHLALRITPSALSMLHLDTLFAFMIENNITAESCNILHEPDWMQLTVVPDNIRLIALEKINKVIEKYQLTEPSGKVVNQRRDDLSVDVIAQVVFEYRRLLETIRQDGTLPEKLVKALRSFETLRNNSILGYLPEYEEFLRSNGY